MSEKIRPSGELEKRSAEALEAAGAEKQRELQEKLIENAERSTGDNLEGARHEALELALSQEEDKKSKESAISKEKPKPERPHKQDLDASFKKTMKRIQKDMSPASRAFSRVIHNPVVDKTSEFVGNTIARPNLILAGAIGTLTIGLGIYIIAKNYGYVLSGFESIGSFILGWCVGAVMEFARVGFINSKSQ